jgi:hypothetical protein
MAFQRSRKRPWEKYSQAPICRPFFGFMTIWGLIINNHAYYQLFKKNKQSDDEICGKGCN